MGGVATPSRDGWDRCRAAVVRSVRMRPREAEKAVDLIGGNECAEEMANVQCYTVVFGHGDRFVRGAHAAVVVSAANLGEAQSVFHGGLWGWGWFSA